MCSVVPARPSVGEVCPGRTGPGRQVGKVGSDAEHSAGFIPVEQTGV